MNYLIELNNEFVALLSGGHVGPLLSEPRVQSIGLGILIALMLWSFVWKGIALWQSARNHQMVWFIFLLVLNTLGLLEIIYILFFRKNKNDTIVTTTVTHTTTSSTPSADPGLVLPPTA